MRFISRGESRAAPQARRHPNKQSPTQRGRRRIRLTRSSYSGSFSCCGRWRLFVHSAGQVPPTHNKCPIRSRALLRSATCVPQTLLCASGTAQRALRLSTRVVLTAPRPPPPPLRASQALALLPLLAVRCSAGSGSMVMPSGLLCWATKARRVTRRTAAPPRGTTAADSKHPPSLPARSSDRAGSREAGGGLRCISRREPRRGFRRNQRGFAWARRPVAADAFAPTRCRSASRRTRQ